MARAQESLKRDVAIKFIDLTLAARDGTTLERFRLESQVTAQLGNRTRHIVAVHDAGEHEGART